MFGVLLESRARRQRRSGGIALSVATHMAIVGAVTVTATETIRKPPLEKPIPVVIAPPAPAPIRKPPRASTQPRQTSPTPQFALPSVVHIDAPTFTPKGIPEIDFTRGVSADSIVIGPPSGGKAGGRGMSILDGDESPSSGPLTGRELMMRIVTTGKPRYPEALRQAGIEGTVVIRFVVDTLGRIDPASVAVVNAANHRFVDAVRAALPAFRFRPAESNGRRVPALAEMPFQFTVTR